MPEWSLVSGKLRSFRMNCVSLVFVIYNWLWKPASLEAMKRMEGTSQHSSSGLGARQQEVELVAGRENTGCPSAMACSLCSWKYLCANLEGTGTSLVLLAPDLCISLSALAFVFRMMSSELLLV